MTGHVHVIRARKDLCLRQDALEFRADALGQRPRQHGLADARHVFEQDMAVAEQRDQHLLDDAVLPLNNLPDILFHADDGLLIAHRYIPPGKD